jgi:hypothetical protein
LRAGWQCGRIIAREAGWLREETQVKQQETQMKEVIPKPAKFKAFNTKRLYTKHGQRIAWTMLKSGRVGMLDLDRGIKYVLDIPRPRDNAEVLAAYDAIKISHAGGDLIELQELESELREAALKVRSLQEVDVVRRSQTPAEWKFTVEQQAPAGCWNKVLGTNDRLMAEAYAVNGQKCGQVMRVVLEHE